VNCSRCSTTWSGTCPAWRVWEYSYSLSAQVARIEYDFSNAIETAESEDDVQSALTDAAEAVREIASAKEEGADNIESGFGHETYQSDELRTQAQDLESWADEIEGGTVPDVPEPGECEECNGEGETDCDECDGTGQVWNREDTEGPDAEEVEEEVDCTECKGTGRIDCTECDQGTLTEPSDDQMEEWRDECRDLLGDCPV